MTWILTIVILLLLLVAWLLLAPISMEIDTALLRARLSWTGIGGASLWYDGQWWVFYTVPFYHKKFNLSGTKDAGGKDAGKAKDAGEKKDAEAKDAGKKKDAGERAKKRKHLPPFSKIIRCIKTFEVKEWRLAIDTGDYALNGQLYPLNFMPQLHEHLEINFIDKNFLFMKIRGIPWKMLYAFIRK